MPEPEPSPVTLAANQGDQGVEAAHEVAQQHDEDDPDDRLQRRALAERDPAADQREAHVHVHERDVEPPLCSDWSDSSFSAPSSASVGACDVAATGSRR